MPCYSLGMGVWGFPLTSALGKVKRSRNDLGCLVYAEL